MRRAVLWGVGAGVLAILMWVVEARSFFRPLLAVAPVVVYAVVLLVRVVMEGVGERPALIPLGSVRRAPRDDPAATLASGSLPSGSRSSSPLPTTALPTSALPSSVSLWPVDDAAGRLVPAAGAAATTGGFDERDARVEELEDALACLPPD